MACKVFTFELECSVCLEIPKMDCKVYQCRNGHLFCFICYSKVVKCPTCQDDLRNFSNEKDTAIRNLAVENIVTQLSSFDFAKSESMERQFEQMKTSFDSFETQIKDFNMKLSLINSKLYDMKSAKSEKTYLMDGFGFVEAYVTARGSDLSVYWGPNREDINFSGTPKSVGTSIEAACHAISQADILGIPKLCIVMNSSVAAYSYIQMFSDWKASKWTSSKGKIIPFASHLELLDSCLKKHHSIAVKFRGATENNQKLKASYALSPSHCLANFNYTKLP